MGLFDTVFGRTKQVQPKLDNLFALPTAALTLRTGLDLVPSGHAGLCFKAGSGESEVNSDADIMSLLNFEAGADAATIATDDLGFKWLLLTNEDLDELVTRLHSANETLVEHGLGPRLLCAVFGFSPVRPPGEGSVKMVYLFKQGSWYPFAPIAAQDRNNELELRIRSFLGTDLPIEKDLSRWMALWGLPVS